MADFIVEVLSGNTSTLVSAKNDSIVEVAQGSITSEFTVRDKEIVEVQLNQGLPGLPGPPGADTGVAIDLAMTAHRDSLTPHPTYDDTPDLTLIFQNGLV